MKKRNIIVIAFVVVSFWIGCTSKKEVSETPTTPIVTCDTTNVRYSVEIVGILNASCNSCHAAPASSGSGIVLNNYTSLKPWANNNTLYHVVNHTPGFSPMPKGGAKIASCDIAKIRTWIRNGAPNN
jgi:PBP1b-binding outer membrane lipoprotein LpoB